MVGNSCQSAATSSSERRVSFRWVQVEVPVKSEATSRRSAVTG